MLAVLYQTKLRRDGRLVSQVRVSVGTGVVLGLWKGQLMVAPTTAYLLTYYPGRCRANCKFCPQARNSMSDVNMLSRVVWPKCEVDLVLEALREHQGRLKRVCIQAINYPDVIDELCELVARIKSFCDLPISISCQPLTGADIKRLVGAGVERISIALDAATPEVFDRVKGREVSGPYEWRTQMKALDEARAMHGDRVSTHLMVGLGETEEDMVRTIQLLHAKGIVVGLFAFTPISGTPLAKQARPNVPSYHRIQLASYLIRQGLTDVGGVTFKDGRITDFRVSREVLRRTVDSGEPFRTSGCQGCNRPFYNESPRGPIYNYPQKLKPREIAMIQDQLGVN